MGIKVNGNMKSVISWEEHHRLHVESFDSFVNLGHITEGAFKKFLGMFEKFCDENGFEGSVSECSDYPCNQIGLYVERKDFFFAASEHRYASALSQENEVEKTFKSLVDRFCENNNITVEDLRNRSKKKDDVKSDEEKEMVP